MNYLKFVGLSLLAGIVFLACLRFVGIGYLSLVLALVITGAGFALVKPKYLKWAYAIWLIASFLLVFLLRKWAELDLELHQPIDPDFLVTTDFMLGVPLLNPICYWLGKRLDNSLWPVDEATPLAERFD
jgi:hypothetical protein